MSNRAWGRDEFEAALRGLGRRYHINHPYHQMMAKGELDPEQIRAARESRLATRATRAAQQGRAALNQAAQAP